VAKSREKGQIVLPDKTDEVKIGPLIGEARQDNSGWQMRMQVRGNGSDLLYERGQVESGRFYLTGPFRGEFLCYNP
jgi:hypothetical protein